MLSGSVSGGGLMFLVAAIDAGLRAVIAGLRGVALAVEVGLGAATAFFSGSLIGDGLVVCSVATLGYCWMSRS